MGQYVEIPNSNGWYVAIDDRNNESLHSTREAAISALTRDGGEAREVADVADVQLTMPGGQPFGIGDVQLDRWRKEVTALVEQGRTDSQPTRVEPEVDVGPGVEVSKQDPKDTEDVDSTTPTVYTPPDEEFDDVWPDLLRVDWVTATRRIKEER